MSAPLLRLRGIVKSYGRGEAAVQALRGVDLDIASGDFVALTGPSGSGKSTLLNLCGLIDSPDSGELLLEGRRWMAAHSRCSGATSSGSSSRASTWCRCSPPWRTSSTRS
jgi:ABC-type lipoprotein export system ATPase subunit